MVQYSTVRIVVSYAKPAAAAENGISIIAVHAPLLMILRAFSRFHPMSIVVCGYSVSSELLDSNSVQYKEMRVICGGVAALKAVGVIRYK
jgi:hypothetical protein